MSAKRSWDVRPNIVRPQQAPPKAERLVASSSVREARGSVREPKGGSREPLKVRRQKARKRLQIIALVGALVLAIALAALLWQPFVRVSVVEAEGPHAEEIEMLAREAIEGTYFFVFPKNSIFIYPELSMREHILRVHPDIVAVSVSRTSFTSLHIKSVPRTSAFMWCGASALTPEPCYQADAEGLVFGQVANQGALFVDAAGTGPATSTEPDLGTLRIYAPLEQEPEDDGTPLRAHVVGAGRLPDALRFVKAMKLLNVGIVSVEIRGDEADLYTPQGTRITYILGREVEAAALAASAFPTLKLNDGSLEYVDLRFEGKVYLKRRGEEAE